MSGLAAGIRLANYGGKTLILERHYRIGGLNSYYRAGGYDMDVGLHAVTNYSPNGPKSAPMARLMRQLRLKMADFKLAPQKVSRIVFPDVTLEFGNDFERFSQNVSEAFPSQKENFRKLVDRIREYDDLDLEIKPVSGREVVRSIITDPLLADMIMLPIMYYGSAEEDDMEFGQFVVIFKSVFFEGLSRPEGGIRVILDLLEKRYMDSGGELRLRAGVSRIVTDNGKVSGVVLDNGEELECGAVFSSAGLPETVGMCPESAPDDASRLPGRISLMESVNILDTGADKLGADASVIFYNNAPGLSYRKPDEPVDVKSGVICFPGNFDYETAPGVDSVRITNLADYEFWMSADDNTYAGNKKAWHERSLEAADAFMPGVKDRIVFSDVFTPRTITKFTGRVNGAVYGSPVKSKNARTPVGGLYIVGADQGFLGIVGAMLSGVTVANIHLMSRQ